MMHNPLSPPKYTGTVNKGGSVVQQQFEPQCNMKTIIAKYRRTGQLPLPVGSPLYGDFRNSPQSLGDAYLIVQQANADFAELSSTIRDRFHNNPVELLQFMADPQNKNEAIELGIIPRPATPELPPGPTIPEPTKAASHGAAAQSST